MSLGHEARLMTLGWVRQVELELHEAALALDEGDAVKARNCLSEASVGVDKAVAALKRG